MTKITESQRVVLAAAATRDDRRVLPFPKSLNKNKGSQSLILSALLTKRFISEVPADHGDDVWRESDGERLALVVTDAGLAEVGVAPEDCAPLDEVANLRGAIIACEKQAEDTEPLVSKITLVVGLLKREGGATIDDIMVATGWQSHSVRGAISGTIKKKLGHVVTNERVDGQRIYRIA